MKFLILSDLHLEFGASYVPPAHGAYDAVILAGDISSKGDVVSWAASAFGDDVPIVIVLGNHEFYGGNMQSIRRKLHADAQQHANAHVLDPGEFLLDMGRIRVLGCELWTDFEIAVETREGPLTHRDGAMEHAWRYMNDYRMIRFSPIGQPERSFEPKDALELHHKERAWLLENLQKPFEGTTIVVSHHGPSSGSVAEHWAGNWLTPAFSSDLPDDFFMVPALWIHGHTHSSRDYLRGRTRVVCNPRGYPSRKRSFENDAFDPGLVIELPLL